MALSRLDSFVLIGILILQCIVCIPFIESFPIELDEPFTIYYSQQNLTDFLPTILAGNNPPLFYVLMHFWIEFFGLSIVAIRSLSLVISLIILLVQFQFTKKVLNLRSAVLVSLLFIFSAYLHHFSLEARMYGLYYLFTFLIFKDTYLCLRNNEGIRCFYIAVWAVLLIYTHYLGVYIVGVIGIIAIVNYKKVALIKSKHLIGSIFLFVLLLTPFISYLISNSGNFIENGTWLTKPHAKQLYGELFKLLNNPFTLLFVLLFVLSSLALAKLKKLELNANKPLLIYALQFFLLLYLGMFTFSLFVQPIFFGRYLVVVLIPIHFLIISSLDAVGAKKSLKWLSLLIIIPFTINVSYAPNINRNTEELIADIQSRRAYETLIIYCPMNYEYLMAYYLSKKAFRAYSDFNNEMKKDGLIGTCDAELLDLSTCSSLIYIDFNLVFLGFEEKVKPVIEKTMNWKESLNYKSGYSMHYYEKEKN